MIAELLFSGVAMQALTTEKWKLTPNRKLNSGFTSINYSQRTHGRSLYFTCVLSFFSNMPPAGTRQMELRPNFATCWEVSQIWKESSFFAIDHLWRYWPGIAPSPRVKVRHSPLASEIWPRPHTDNKYSLRLRSSDNDIVKFLVVPSRKCDIK